MTPNGLNTWIQAPLDVIGLLVAPGTTENMNAFFNCKFAPTTQLLTSIADVEGE
jgi:hypothetical protein